MKKLSKKQIKKVTKHILNGLMTDGGHHKQWDLEQALIALRGKDWVNRHRYVCYDADGNERVVEDPDNCDEDTWERWEEGIP